MSNVQIPEITFNIPYDSIVKRKNVDSKEEFRSYSFEYGGYRCSITRNYLTLGGYGSYGPEQEIKFLGWKVNVFKHLFKQAFGKVDSLEDIPLELERLKQELDARCDHRSSVLVKNLGRCWNKYKCNDCGATYNIDSSD